MTRRRPSRSFVILCALVAVVTTACIPQFGDEVGTLRRGTLVAGNGQGFRSFENGTSTVVYTDAPWTNDKSTEVFWSRDAPYLADVQACVTWNTTARSSLTDAWKPTQPGLALRIAPSGSGNSGLRAVTIRERTDISFVEPFAIDFHHLDVDVWDTADAASPSTRVASFDASEVVGQIAIDTAGATDSLAPPPWHICGRTLADQLTVKIWTGTNPEPAWDDAAHTFVTTLPTEWNQAGYAGATIGHLGHDRSATFANLQAIPTCLADDLMGIPPCSPPDPTAPGEP